MRDSGRVVEDGRVTDSPTTSYVVGSVLQFTVDDRYTNGAFASTKTDSTWQMPFLGWAVVADETTDVLVPVFLQEDDGRAVTLPDLQRERGARLLRLMPVDPGGLH